MQRKCYIYLKENLIREPVEFSVVNKEIINRLQNLVTWFIFMQFGILNDGNCARPPLSGTHTVTYTFIHARAPHSSSILWPELQSEHLRGHFVFVLVHKVIPLLIKSNRNNIITRNKFIIGIVKYKIAERLLNIRK